MGIRPPHDSPSSRQLTLNLELGLAEKHGSLRACLAARVYAVGIDRVAPKIDMSPSKLCEKLGGGNGDRKRDVGLDDLEAYLDAFPDRTPILYLIDKYMRDPAAAQLEALAGLAELAEQLPALLQAAGIKKRAR